MAYVLGKDLDNWVDSVSTREPYAASGDENIGAQYMTGTDLLRSAKINPEWKQPLAVYAQSYNPLYISGQMSRSFWDSLADYINELPYNMENLAAQNALETLQGESKSPDFLKLANSEFQTLAKGIQNIAALGIIIPGLKETSAEIKEKAQTYDELVDLLQNQEYPLEKYAKRVIADNTNHVENRRIVRELYKQSQGIDSKAWYNQMASILGAMTPAIVAGSLGHTGALIGGASRANAINTAMGITQGLIGMQAAGEYAEETASEYLRRTGDRNFENFTAKDATGLGAIAYGAINSQIEFLGGVEPIMAGALNKVGLRAGGIKAALKIGAGEATEEFLQGITELLMRKMDGTTDKTWGDGILEALNGAVWGMFIGGVTGTPAFYMNRRNLVNGIRKAFPQLDSATATQIADAMIDTVGEASSQDQTLRNNLRKKIEFMYSKIDLDNKEDRIDAMTDLEYTLAVMDASDRGIDLKDHELFQGEVTPIGWFRAGIPENMRTEIQTVIDNITELETQLEELNKAKEKDWAKIEEIENKLAQQDEWVRNKLSDIISKESFARELNKLESKYVAKQKKKAGIPVDTVEPTGKTYTDAEILGMFAKAKNDGDIKLDNWENVRWSSLLSAGDTYQKGKRNKPATEADKAKFARKMLDKYMPGWNKTTQTTGIEFQDEVFKIADENARLDDIYPEYTGETIEVDGKERTVYNSNGDRIAKSAEALRNFWKWFGNSKVVDEQGRPLVVYHGALGHANLTEISPEYGFNVKAVYTSDNKNISTHYAQSSYIKRNIPNIKNKIADAKSIEDVVEILKNYGKDVKIIESFTDDKGAYYRLDTGLSSETLGHKKSDTEYETSGGLKINLLEKLKKYATRIATESETSDLYPLYLSLQNPLIVDANKKSFWKIDFEGKTTNTETIVETAKERNYDGVIVKNVYETDYENVLGNDYIAFKSNQIKSVDNRGTFSENTPNIYWQNRASGAAPSTYRGAYIPQYRFIQRTNKMDASTLSHELAHDWFETNFYRYRDGKMSKDFMKAWGALEKALGITEKDKVPPRQASEIFARAYEAWLTSNENWNKLIAVDDKDKDAVAKLMQDYQNALRDIYNDISNPYFKQTWGKLGELKPELKAWFDRMVDVKDLDVLVERGEMTPEQASQEKLNQAIDKVIENTKDAETAQTLKEVRTLNDTKRYESEGGNKNSIQMRLSALAREIDENNMAVKGESYDTHRDMMAVAEAADNFVKTRLEDALAIINGQMAEVEGLFKEDLYTALERLAIENGDMGLIDELRNSEVANRLAKELGQRVAGFRNWKSTTEIDVLSAVKSLDNKFNEALKNKKAQKQFNEALDMLDKELKAQDKLADKELDATLKELECK